MLFGNLLVLAASGIKLASAFTRVTDFDVWEKMNPGWNIGNTLDAIPDETSWGNPLISGTLLDSIKAYGIKSVRIPVTWTDHFASQAPDYVVNATWLTRVEQVVDWSLERGFWVVLNVHHDSWQWADLSNDSELTTKFTKLEKLWQQIAYRFRNKSEKLILESLNEPQGSTQVHAERYNDANQRFVNIVRSSGGYNKDRLLTLPGLNTNIANTVNWFTVPENAEPYFLHVHNYDPWDFVSTSWGRTWWGSESDKAEITNTFSSLAAKFQRPALIGEWGLTGTSVEKAASWIYFDHFVRTSRQYNLTAQLWDNGGDHFDRTLLAWRDPTKYKIMIAAVKGINNILPSNEQTAIVYFKKGSTASDVSINLVFNGQTINFIVNGAGATLRRNTDYTVTAAGITLKQAYLATKISGAVGLKDSITIKPSGGAELTFEFVVYDKPTTASTSLTIPVTQDYYIPINPQGSTLATVKAVRADGVFLKDDWTQWLGSLQQGRINWGDFGVSGNNVVLYPALLQTIKDSGGPVTLTFEYWPRTDTANNVTITVTAV